MLEVFKKIFMQKFAEEMKERFEIISKKINIPVEELEERYLQTILDFIKEDEES